jgi:HK97 family phage major capsid protein
MSNRIQLTREASDLRNRAGEIVEGLKSTIEAQRAEGFEGTRLTADEIAQRKDEAQALISEAKALEDLNSLDGLMARPDEQKSTGARVIENTYSGAVTQEEGGSVLGGKTLGHFMRAIRSAHGQYENSVDLSQDERKEISALRKLATDFDKDVPLSEITVKGHELKTLVGDNTGSSGRGDYLVPPEHLSELLRAMGENQQFINRARRVPMNRRVVDFPRLAQTDGDNTRPMYSFAAVVTIGEAAEKPEREPTFEQLVLTAYKYAAYVEASDELLSDSIVDLPPVLATLLTDAIAYEYDRDGIRGAGDGSSRPQGFIGSNAEFAVERGDANEIGLEDIFAMESRLFGEGIYMFHPSAIPQLYGLTKDNIVVWNGDASAATPGTLLGRELVRTHKLPTLGNKGDLCLVDPSFYLAGDLQRITIANSIHYRFRNDVTAWRAVFRGAGTPWPAGTFSSEASGGNKTWEVSPFVVLGDPAAS